MDLAPDEVVEPIKARIPVDGSSFPHLYLSSNFLIEAAKSLVTFDDLSTFLSIHRFTRSSLIVV